MSVVNGVEHHESAVDHVSAGFALIKGLFRLPLAFRFLRCWLKRLMIETSSIMLAATNRALAGFRRERCCTSLGWRYPCGGVPVSPRISSNACVFPLKHFAHAIAAVVTEARACSHHVQAES